MDFQYEIDPARWRVTARSTGTLDLTSSIETIRAVVSDPAFGSRFGVLWDSRALAYASSLHEAMQLGRLLPRLGMHEEHPLALVVSGSGDRDSARLMAVVVNAWGGKMAVFTDLEAAEAWLSLQSVQEPENT